MDILNNSNTTDCIKNINKYINKYKKYPYIILSEIQYSKFINNDIMIE